VGIQDPNNISIRASEQVFDSENKDSKEREKLYSHQDGDKNFSSNAKHNDSGKVDHVPEVAQAAEESNQTSPDGRRR